MANMTTLANVGYGGPIAAFGAALLVSLALMPLAVSMGQRFSLVVRPRLFGRSTNPISYLGGLAVASATCAVAALVSIFEGLPDPAVVVVSGAVLLLLFGIADDRMTSEVHPVVRLAAETIVAGAVWWAGLRPTPTGIGWIDAILTIFFLVAATNAFNLLDNMDGVAASTGAAIAGGVALLALLSGQVTLSLLAAALCGGVLGFLPHNLFHQRIYLGNGGSLFLGFVIGSLTLMLDFPLPQPWGFGSAIVLLAVPVADTSLVVVSRLRAGRSVFQGGVDHVSHRLSYLGVPTKAAAATHAAASVLGTSAILIAIADYTGSSIVAGLILLVIVVLMLLRVDVYQESVRSDPEGVPLPQHYRRAQPERARGSGGPSVNQ
jgi:UDP-GlcNAc:undecaprenyl-phosphate GlcNAc-1-phosphate transferase